LRRTNKGEYAIEKRYLPPFLLDKKVPLVSYQNNNYVMIKYMKRDIEKAYTKKQFVEKLRRLADSIEQDKRFSIQIAGKRISVPGDAVMNIEHEKERGKEEVEFQIKWTDTGR